MKPKVFVSHATEDKERFVLQFAERLRQNGIDAWVDRWEMHPGDSLVSKIFDEGIRNAQAVIVVLSKVSVEKPWVKEELNVACVNRINNGCKLIPVVIDDCEIPEVLIDTLWERIADLSSYQLSLDRIVASIFGVTDKPPLGSPPEYLQSFGRSIDGLNNIDSLVLKLSCKAAIESDNKRINPGNVFLREGRLHLPDQELKDALEVLDGEGYIKLVRDMVSSLFSYDITTLGLETYANAYIPNYQETIVALISAIVNKNMENNIELQQELNIPKMLLDHILDVLEAKSFLSQKKLSQGFSQLSNVSPALRRFLDAG